jgi:alpha-tubulin suppressor-like RCC1 family protein
MPEPNQTLPPPPALPGFEFVSAGREHTCGYRGNPFYEPTCWGGNGAGQLGNGTTTNKSSPGFSFIVGLWGITEPTGAAVAGGGHSCGYGYGKSFGFFAHCWGDNSSGQLGNGTTANSTSAVPVAAAANGDIIDGGGFSGVVATGGNHSCGASLSRITYCWGANGSGQLGNGTTTNSAIPVAIGGGLGLAELTAGTNHTCGITATGAAYCWGSNSSGQLGGATTANSAVPLAVAGGTCLQEPERGGQLNLRRDHDQ